MTVTLESLISSHGRSLRDVLRERGRQVGPLGHTEASDDALPVGALIAKAVAKLASIPQCERHHVVEACAVLLAEVERLDRGYAREGSEAARAGEPIQACPYTSGDPRAGAWREGYLRAVDDMARPAST